MNNARSRRWPLWWLILAVAIMATLITSVVVIGPVLEHLMNFGAPAAPQPPQPPQAPQAPQAPQPPQPPQAPQAPQPPQHPQPPQLPAVGSDNWLLGNTPFGPLVTVGVLSYVLILVLGGLGSLVWFCITKRESWAGTRTATSRDPR